MILPQRWAFMIRQFSGNPGPDWVFEPVPEEAAVFFDGMPLKVCLPDRQIDAFVNVGKINGNDRIVPGAPVGQKTVQGILIQAPDADINTLGGCPC